MSIQLNEVFHVGELAADGPYTHFRIHYFAIDLHSRTITITGKLGRDVDGVWLASEAKTNRTYTITGSDYDTLTDLLPAQGETIYDAASRALYEHLQTNDTRLAGVIS